ncbi:MAG: hypothetical protein Kow00129_12580 [Thermoleophilia bacterium]
MFDRHVTGHPAAARRAFSTTVLVLLVFLLVAGSALGQTTTTLSEATDAGADTSESAAVEPAPADPAAGLVAPAPEGIVALNPDLAADQLAVQIWPEYDSADILVMADIRLAADVQFPVQMKVAIPRGARLSGVAEVREDGSFDYSRPAPTPDLASGTDEWDVYNLTIPKLRDVRVEYYYDPGINTAGPRDFSVVYRVPMDAGQATVSVQQPLRSSEFTVTPLLSQSTTDSTGFNYVSETVGAVEENQLIQMRVAYQKSDAQPSITDEAQAGATDSNTRMLLWLIVILAVGVLGFVGYRMFLRPAAAPAGRTRGGSRRSGRGAQAKASAQKTSGPVRFCTQCGARLGKRDRFCPECGHERE